ncbi:MAG: hypothetical protein HGA69_00375, partial [Desulfobulbaceae bacterium]|nr:hypothetical protein [Desulfobulbaceae bacterium]
YTHANVVPLRPGVVGRTVPVAALVMNVPAGDHSTGLMEHGEVNTFLGWCDEVRAAYHRAEYMVDRKKMLHWWADYLEAAKTSNQ